ncbi:aminotransferase class I/II-fold pyridoxal phosphate-dependent enzyme [Neptuniibacter halophilus]|uniref:aminotransferase class I/II-fold pyridoxal phosphate-dependent enzyme n=1 Tax=Neptuniibacter halophilus TaxID=651666 RepID=UPI00257356F9|nr:aminotransferase class I/II-fold pyridoxal phosphate-dependent enzyme [Neptuniibacter halophilus]
MSWLIHGGDLFSASERYGIDPAQWLDLSTGINPRAYPLPALPEEAYQRLPYQSAQFREAVKGYYGVSGVACSGTQQVIERLPDLLPCLPVLLPACGYQEHRASWQQAGAEIAMYPADDPQAAAEFIEQWLSEGKAFHLLLINPNNPSGLCFEPEQICRWAERLPEPGVLICDEAFIDLWPARSLLAQPQRFQDLGNLLVLRSFGKFFGLAGIRLGFAFGSGKLCSALAETIGPWAVNGPAQAVACAALSDHRWQQQARQQIEQNSALTAELFAPLMRKLNAQPLQQEGLFLSWRLPSEQAEAVYLFFARRGILLRLVSAAEQGDKNSQFSLLRSGLVEQNHSPALEQLRRVISEYIFTVD